MGAGLDPSLSSAHMRGGPTQQRLRATIGAVGGYWRPLAGVARLLEELGEVGEALGAGHSDSLPAELADVWIISAAIGDQFLAELLEPAELDREQGSGSFGELVAAAGVLARIVNHYDGPKRPRPGAPLGSLAGAVNSLHGVLGRLGAANAIELAPAIEAKLASITTRDATRFTRTRDDPSTAPCLAAFRTLAKAGPLAADDARLWGGSVATSELLPSLRSFARAALPERFDAFVIEGTTRQLGTWLTSLHRALDQAAAPGQILLEGLPLQLRSFDAADARDPSFWALVPMPLD